MITIKPAVVAVALCYYAAGSIVAAVDTLGGDKAVTVGVGGLVLAVATAAGVLIMRSANAYKAVSDSAMQQVAELRAELAEERDRHDQTRRELYQVRIILAAKGIAGPP